MEESNGGAGYIPLAGLLEVPDLAYGGQPAQPPPPLPPLPRPAAAKMAPEPNGGAGSIPLGPDLAGGGQPALPPPPPPPPPPLPPPLPRPAAAKMALEANGGAGYDSLAAFLEGLDLPEGGQPPRLPLLRWHAGSSSTSQHEDADASEALPAPNPTATGARTSDTVATATPSPNPTGVSASTTSAASDLGGGVGLLDESKEKEDDKKKDKASDKKENKDEKDGNKKENKDEKDGNKKEKEEKKEEEHTLARLAVALSVAPSYVTRTAMVIEGLSEIVSGLKVSKAVIGPAISGVKSSVKSSVSIWRDSSVVSVCPRAFESGEIGLRLLLNRQAVTSWKYDRAIKVQDISGDRRMSMPRMLQSINIIRTMKDLEAIVAQFKHDGIIRQIDVESGCISLDLAKTMWSYLCLEEATCLVSPNSTLVSLAQLASSLLEYRENC